MAGRATILRSIASLYALQFVSYFIPLFLTPYLTRTLGVESFGVLAICGSVVAYLSLISNWGFDLSASQQVAQAAEDPARLRVVFWDTLLAKLLLGAAGFVLLAAITMMTDTLSRHWPTMLAYSLVLLSSMLSVNWFLQGLEKMGTFALASLAGRLLSVPLTFLLVHSPGDTALAALIQAGTLCISAGASLYGSSKFVPLLPMRFSLAGAFAQIADGARLFLSTAAVSLYTYTNLLAVGFISGPYQAGLFDGADRIKRAGQSLTGPIGSAMYPRINRMMVHSRHRAPATMLWLLAVQGAFTFLLSAALFVTAPYLTVLFLGKAYAAATPITEWLSLNVFLIGVSNVLGINIMLPLGMKRAFTAILVGSGFVNLGLLFVLTHRSGALGAAQSVTLTEAIVTVAMAFWVATHGREFWGSGREPPADPSAEAEGQAAAVAAGAPAP